MDNELQKIHQIRPLVLKVLGYRNNIQLYHKLHKEISKLELENTVTAEIQLTQRELKMPDESLVPPLTEIKYNQPEKVNELIERFDSLKEGLALL